MNRLEDELKSALRRVEPPSGFTARVMARVDAQSPRPRRQWPAWLFGTRHFAWAATAALALVVLVGVLLVQNRQERVKAEAAKREVMSALHFAGDKLNIAMRRAEAIGNQKSESGSPRKSPGKMVR
jgi:hypothetical protein